MSREEAEAHLALAEEKLGAAGELLRGGYHRDAASRAYYAMFNAAQALVRSRGHAPRTHRGLRHLLFEEFSGEEGFSPDSLAVFRKAQQVREMGDYDAALEVTEEDAEVLLDDARDFVGRVREMLD